MEKNGSFTDGSYQYDFYRERPYYHYWSTRALAQYKQATGLSDLDVDGFFDYEGQVSNVSNKLYILSTKDDQVTNNHNFFDKGTPRFMVESEVVNNVIRTARLNQNVRVFNPIGGGHMEYAVDTEWMGKLIETFYK